jgi:hypothetical protein
MVLKHLTWSWIRYDILSRLKSPIKVSTLGCTRYCVKSATLRWVLMCPNSTSRQRIPKILVRRRFSIFPELDSRLCMAFFR